MNGYSSQSPDNRPWSKCLTPRTLSTYIICTYILGGNICVVLGLMSYAITGSTYTMLFSLYQLIAFLILARTTTFIYKAPTGSLEELTGPNSREFATAENFGHILCYTISVWFLWWFWIDYRRVFFSVPIMICSLPSISLPVLLCGARILPRLFHQEDSRCTISGFQISIEFTT